MDVKKTLANGLDVLGLSQEELYALLNFSSINLESFPFGVFGTTAPQVDASALAGYTTLMQAKCFQVSGSGYPELTDNNKTIVNAISALRRTDEFLVLRLTMERKKLQLIMCNSASAWMIAWRSGKEWMLIAANEISSISLTVINLIAPILRKSLDSGPSVTMDFDWYRKSGDRSMHTTIKNKSSDRFREAKPDDDALSMTSPTWPKTYWYLQILDRVEELVNM